MKNLFPACGDFRLRMTPSFSIENAIHIDDFANPRKIRDNGDYYETAIDYEMLINEILEPLKKIGNINKEIVCLNIDTDKYENKRRYQIDNETVVLIEGFLLFRPPMLEYLDGKIFLYIDFAEVIKRTTIRDVPKYGEQFIGLYHDLFIPTQKRYLNEFEPQKNCDIFIDNSDYNNPVLQIYKK